MRCSPSLGFTLLIAGVIGCSSRADEPGSSGGKNKGVEIPGPFGQGGAGGGEFGSDELLGSPDDSGMEPANGPPMAFDETCEGSPFSKTLYPADTNTMVEALSASQDISEGRSPLPASIRAQDFFNYYGIDLTGQNVGSDGRAPYVAVEGVKRSAPGRYDLAVAIQAPPIQNEQRKPLVLTLVVDVTPSMWGLGLTQAQAALTTLAANLQKGDRVELVTTAPTPTVQIEISGPDDPALLAAAAKLEIDNAGTLEEALGFGYDAARASAQGGAWNRVIVLSAGDAPEEAVPEESIASAAEEQQIFLVAAATGSTYGKFQRFLAKASRVGRGPYVYLGAQGAAEEMFGARFNELVGYSFDDLEVSLTLPGHARLLQDGPSVPAATATPVAQYIGPGASQLFLFRLQTCITPPSTDIVGVTVTYTDADGVAGTPVTKDFSFPDKNTVADRPVYDKTAAIVAYVDALRSMDAKRIHYAQDAVTFAEGSSSSADDLADLGSIGQLLAQHPALSEPE